MCRPLCVSVVTSSLTSSAYVLDHCASFGSRSHLSDSPITYCRHLLDVCFWARPARVCTQNTAYLMTFTTTLPKMEISNMFLLPAFLHISQDVFVQLEPRRRCCEAALADASRELETCWQRFRRSSVFPTSPSLAKELL